MRHFKGAAQSKISKIVDKRQNKISSYTLKADWKIIFKLGILVHTKCHWLLKYEARQVTFSGNFFVVLMFIKNK